MGHTSDNVCCHAPRGGLHIWTSAVFNVAVGGVSALPDTIAWYQMDMSMKDRGVRA